MDRAAVAKIVFAPPPDGPEQLAYLERITHPRIGARILRRIEELKLENRVAAVLDAPLMFKAGWDKYCDIVLFIDAPLDQRLSRARRRGWTDEQYAARESAQTPVEVKRGRADVVIDNSGSIEQTLTQTRHIWNTRIIDQSP